MIIYGKNPVKEALMGDTAINKIILQKGLHDTKSIIDLANSKRIRIDFCDKFTLDKTAESERHQGVVAICDEYLYCAIDDIMEKAKKQNQKLLMLILDGVEDPHNLGSIIRVAECAGAHGIVIPKHRAVSVNATVAKVSAGAVSHVLIARVTNINDTIRSLRDRFINVVCADMDGTPMYKSHLEGDTAIVIGGEGEGVKPLTRKLCEEVVSIPQFGKVNSLNASVACGIITYEAIRQRQK